jgi:AP-1 complex subunit beta-1
VRKSIKAIGQTAVKIDAAVERCVNVLLDLIATRVSYVVQEAVVVMKVRFPLISPFPLAETISVCFHQDIFRKYPSTYEGVIPTLCANLDELDEPEAKALLIWIIGEYSNKIDNADELLGIFVDTFTEESYAVCGFNRVRSYLLSNELLLGTTANPHSSRESLSQQTEFIPRNCPEDS